MHREPTRLTEVTLPTCIPAEAQLTEAGHPGSRGWIGKTVVCGALFKRRVLKGEGIWDGVCHETKGRDMFGGCGSSKLSMNLRRRCCVQGLYSDCGVGVDFSVRRRVVGCRCFDRWRSRRCVRGSVRGGSVRGCVRGGSVRGCVRGGSVRGCVRGGSVRGSRGVV
jgi:hypothetical protein